MYLRCFLLAHAGICFGGGPGDYGQDCSPVKAGLGRHSGELVKQRFKKQATGKTRTVAFGRCLVQQNCLSYQLDMNKSTAIALLLWPAKVNSLWNWCQQGNPQEMAFKKTSAAVAHEPVPWATHSLRPFLQPPESVFGPSVYLMVAPTNRWVNLSG